MSLFGIGASTVANIAGSLIGGALSNSASAAASKQQHDWNVDDYQHRYQWSMQDMQKAGLNPVLAATQGIGGSINGASALSNSYDLSSAASSGVSAESQKKQAQNAASLISSTNEKNYADARAAASSANKLEVDTESGRIANRLANDSYDSNLAAAKQRAENEAKLGKLYDTQQANAEYQRNVVMPAQAALAYAQGNAANSAAAFSLQNTENAKLDYEYRHMKNKDYKDIGVSDDGGVWSTLGRTANRWFNNVGEYIYNRYGQGGSY